MVYSDVSISIVKKNSYPSPQIYFLKSLHMTIDKGCNGLFEPLNPFYKSISISEGWVQS